MLQRNSHVLHWLLSVLREVKSRAENGNTNLVTCTARGHLVYQDTKGRGQYEMNHKETQWNHGIFLFQVGPSCETVTVKL
jgi:hypothetical protein